MRVLKTTSMAVALVLAAALPTSAAPLDRGHVPADAKWVLHLDYDQLRETTLAERVRKKRPELVKSVRKWFQERYGIDLRTDLQAVTMFSDSYESHTGTIILFADFDSEKVRSDLQKKQKIQTSSWQGHTLYTFKVDKRGQDQEKKTMAIVLLDGKKAIFASSVPRAKAAVKLLQGDAPSLEQRSSKLPAETPEGAVAYGAAIDLQKIARHDGVFPILRQHERILWTAGERDGELFEAGRLVSQSEDVAQQVKTALEGFVALMKVWAADSKSLSKIADNVEIAQEGSVVEFHWKGDADTVVSALEDMKERWREWRQAIKQ